MELAFASLAALLAGFIDSIVGGGGLVLIPALFATFPNANPSFLFGTNKATAVWGTAIATHQYSRRVAIPWRTFAPAVATGFVAALAGTWVLTRISPTFLRQLLPLVLVLLLLYTLAKKELGRHHAPKYAGAAQVWIAMGIAAVVGFYDGFLGPGTGSFFVFLLVRLLGFDFLHASACAKLLNTATNIAALALFAAKGYVWWHFAAVMALANVAGSFAGSHLALKHGAGFVRGIFVCVVSALILKTGYDAYWGLLSKHL